MVFNWISGLIKPKPATKAVSTPKKPKGQVSKGSATPAPKIPTPLAVKPPTVPKTSVVNKKPARISPAQEQAETRKFATQYLAQPVRQAPAPTPTPSYANAGGGGGYWVTSGGGGGGGARAALAEAAIPTPPRLTDDEWLEKDTSYQGLLASLDNQLKSFQTENTANRERTVEDYQSALARMGWDAENESWNTEDRTTGFGQAYQALMNDFASRGMLQSTLYDQARTDLQSNYGRQRDEMGTAHTNALEELARALSGYETETQQRRDQARMEALARRASLEMGG